MTSPRRLLTVVVLVTLLAGAVLVLARSQDADERTVTVTFARTTGLYEGAKVKVLGVAVGRVESIRPEGASVEATLSYRGDVRLPKDVVAAIVPPSIVGDRFVQLAPVYDGGPELADGARLGIDRSRVPVELDETFSALSDLAQGLGPEGANRDGSLSRFVDAAAANLQGRGATLNQTLVELAAALRTLDAAGGDVSTTVRNLGTVTGRLAGDDDTVRSLVTGLTAVSTNLAAQRGDISAAVTELRSALTALDGLVAQNRAPLEATLADAADVTDTITGRTKELSRLLDLLSAGVGNLAEVYVPTNWDPSRPWESVLEGRTGSLVLRPALLQDLDTQLGFTLGAVCAQLPGQARAGLDPLCSALTGVGGSLGGLLSRLVEANAGGPVGLSDGLGGLLGGGR
ncbi:MCE family protein [Nocardioides sp. LML1-1-1.1]|uniref:MCE family protein n=1 Tax=Nocardioides sp. LML1-1-1.1 TaxID=3135248 RepID=UPI003441F0F9